jgi:hypothetical protein
MIDTEKALDFIKATFLRRLAVKGGAYEEGHRNTVDIWTF